MDAQHRVIENGAVAVRGERIVAVGTSADLAKRYQPKQRIEAPDGILIPGLINTHTHVPMTLFRGIADDVRLQDWLEKYIFPAEAKNVTPEFVRWGTRLGCLEMLLSGTTTFIDMYYFEDVVAETSKECGMRGMLGQTIIRLPGSRREDSPGSTETRRSIHLPLRARPADHAGRRTARRLHQR